ncbi:NAD(P)/FAD-dependent oxidoreductase [Streptomyces rapamycinicus]|uniref:Pyridine nucleotide-disulfide oxidoreductase n=2 Tax=Streptomyces rapamycinicus TaxID=1226757 RepID=A0A0A0NEA5_STRRN|nr:FAD-dependent oxidoreductase [Streptomyces rapamycinicus]AGP52775.1 FAD-dependent pyridine nucleotide-disulfide oxidoreductase [Streptomyces rapamycinicus NRRL 5491]MBB4780249.1 NADH dehydrogenase FAD-containing subunit [Streptomyces rapamycinicus]RLV75096.1 pyridine nucleotide-disulfide oxidoreductase [Streptomyces rapamycinicus NRRL 5491]UTO60986.1 FAD-dependent oxidoreductase [Streptomyces rapamycinicus]UTP28930.1 FAD-dependent oxidoreductase [Streptomyces rapamycinicus NRRL 5491]
MEKQQVLVLGAGYAGLIAALRLAPHTHVTLIDPSPAFTERVRLHERAVGRPDITHPLDALTRRAGIVHVAARATGIEPAARLITTDDGRRLPYDRLVYALGSRTADPGERAYTPETAAELYKRLLDGPGELTVVGGGLTGIELAAEIAESHDAWKVRLVTGEEVGTGLSAKGRAHVRTTLTGLGVRIEEGRRVARPEDIGSDAVVWATAMTANTALAGAAGIALDPGGRVRVDATLRSVSHPEIYAVGDAAAMATPAAGALRMACATALPSGSHAASSIIAETRGREPKPLRFRFVAQCVSLGRRDGLIQLVRADDSPRETVLRGGTAARAKEQVVRSTVRVLRLAARRPGAVPLIPGVG